MKVIREICVIETGCYLGIVIKKLMLMLTLIFSLTAGLANICWATDSQQIDESASNWQDQLIQDVLEHDIRQALRNSQEKSQSPNVIPKSILAPRLVALYGVGKALMAEVQVGNQAYLYIRGQTYPAGYMGDNRVYRLKAMNGACIQLEKESDKHSLCLRMLLGEAPL